MALPLNSFFFDIIQKCSGYFAHAVDILNECKKVDILHLQMQIRTNYFW